MANLVTLSTCLHFAAANVGSFGKSQTITNGNRRVRRNLLYRMTNAEGKFGKIDALCVQECGSFDFQCAPFFNGPLVTNEGISYQDFRPRGVATYSSNADIFPTPNTCSEISISIHNYKYKNPRNRWKTCCLALINTYRNHNQSPECLIQEIEGVMDQLRSKGVTKFVCIGDFNNEEIEITGLKQISHPLLSHKHNHCSDPKFIDMVFSNIDQTVIVAVDDSVENKGPGLGHKFFVVRVGTEEKQVPITIKKILPGRLRKAAKNAEIKKLTEDYWSSTPMRECSEKINEIFNKILKYATATKKITKPKEQRIVTLEDIEDKIDCTQDKNIQKYFYNFVDRFRKKKVRDTSDVRPKLEDFVDVLETKLEKLNKADYAKVDAIVEEAHIDVGAANFWENNPCYQRIRDLNQSRRKPLGQYVSISGPSFPSITAFRKLVFSLSNSNAKDYTGLSTQNLKTILRFNPDLINCIYFFTMKIFKEGKMPSLLKQDKIGFLYKRKGCRKKAKSYRPITIAPTIGKIIEKVLAAELDRIDDGNDWNHAYRKSKSTQSAVINAIEITTKFKREAAKLRAKGLKAKIVLLAEDISSAFESIDGETICNYLKPFDINPGFRMADVTRSYLDRDAVIEEAGRSGPVRKPNSSRSSPQGSILSCRYWRIFDGLATRSFVNSVNLLACHSSHLHMFHHISYADDHLSICLFAWEEEQMPMEISHHILCIRKLFDDATKEIGCGMNPDKSEIILDESPPGIKEDDFSNCFIWLGYSLQMKDNDLIFNKTKFTMKKNEIRNYCRDIFQYAPTISIKRRIFTVYIAPIIDYYLPALIMTNQNMANDLELFQKEILKQVLGVPRSCPGNQVEKVLKILPVSKRLERACERYEKYLITEPSNLSLDSGVTTRTRTHTKTIHEIAARIRWLASPAKGKILKLNPYNAKFAKKWAIATNARFSKFYSSAECSQNAS